MRRAQPEACSSLHRQVPKERAELIVDEVLSLLGDRAFSYLPGRVVHLAVPLATYAAPSFVTVMVAEKLANLPGETRPTEGI